MKSQKIKLVYFSPTGTTQKVLEGIAKGINVEVSNVIDITKPALRDSEMPSFGDGLVLIGAPVYAGRLPSVAAECFRKMKANKTPAALLVLYGNREYEDALLELKDIAVMSGFKPVACGAFIGEHSFSSDEFPLAQSRPDIADMEKAEAFGKEIAAKLNEIESVDSMSDVHVSGNKPYREGMKLSAMDFIEVTDECDNCGICAEVCPNGAINEDDAHSTDTEKCIYCCACIKFCPVGARVLKDGKIKDIAKHLSQSCKQRKEPETFLG
jgi:ferredoxin/menaquinone-dependent protoporphyrinogen IX oxidase